MTNKLDILGADKRCMWYMELHYGSSFKGRTRENLACFECRGYDTSCGMYQAYVKPDYTPIDNWIKENLIKKRNKTLEGRS